MTYFRGLIYALLSGLFLSTGGLLVRYLDGANPWTVLFYRSLAFSVTVLLFMLWRYRREFVTNTVLLLSTGPFFAAILGLAILGEAVTRATWLAMTVAMVGVAIMVSTGVSADDAVGMLLAVLAVLSYAAMLVVLRSAKESGGRVRELLPATALAGILAALFSMPMIDSYALDQSDFLLSLSFGSVQVGVGFILITLAAQIVPAAQVALLSLTETALAPLWVWLVFTETPGAHTLIGGAIIVAAVLYNGTMALRTNNEQ